MVFDIAFPSVPCAVLTMESADLAGTQELGSLASLTKASCGAPLYLS
jgi:hypothetical protein